eukprot:7349399-Prymnesium_polylepis.1
MRSSRPTLSRRPSSSSSPPRNSGQTTQLSRCERTKARTLAPTVPGHGCRPCRLGWAVDCARAGAAEARVHPLRARRPGATRAHGPAGDDAAHAPAHGPLMSRAPDERRRLAAAAAARAADRSTAAF